MDTTGCNHCVTWDTKWLHIYLLLVVTLVTHLPKEPYIKTMLLQNRLQKNISLNQNRPICHSCLVVWTADVHQPKIFHHNNTKDGKEHFRWDEFQLLLRFWLMTFLVATEHLTKECCKHNCWLFERGQKFKMHGREWIKANQKWSCCQLSIPPERAHGKCSTLLAQCSCCVWKFLTKAHKNQATSTEFLDLGVRQDVKLGGHWQWLLVLKKLCKLC